MTEFWGTLEQLFPTLLIIWLPIDDLSIKSILSYSLAKFIISLIRKLSIFILKFFPLLPFVSNFRKNYIKINQNMLQYENLLLYISENYAKNIVGYNASCDEDNEIKYDIDEINSMHLPDTFEYEGKKYKIFLQTDKNKIDEKSNKLNREILVKGNCNTNILKRYIEYIHYSMSEKLINRQNALKIYRMHFDESKNKEGEKKIFKGWKKYICLTNKTIKNTIASKVVKSGFLDAIEEFINSPEKYKVRGMPYKIGFALYGEPGCGKTSIIKAVAQHYNIPIFVINLDIIKNNDMFIKVTNAISNYVTSGKLHILLFEDIDRCRLFNNNYYAPNISMNTLLNILDGVDETHGRINILSANNLSKLSNDTALCRPGRIDKVIHFSYCCDDQIEKILEIFFPGETSKHVKKLDKDIIITPATLTQIIITLNNITKVIMFLNEHKNFKKMEYNVLFNNMSHYNDTSHIKSDEEIMEQCGKDEDEDEDKDVNDNLNDIVKTDEKNKINHIKMPTEPIKQVRPKKLIIKVPQRIIDNIIIYKHLNSKMLDETNIKLEKITNLIEEQAISKNITCIKLCDQIRVYESNLSQLSYYYNLVMRTYEVQPSPILLKMLLIDTSFVKTKSFYAERHNLNTKQLLTSYRHGKRGSNNKLIKLIDDWGSEILELLKYRFNGCNYTMLYKLYDSHMAKSELVKKAEQKEGEKEKEQITESKETTLFFNPIDN